MLIARRTLLRQILAFCDAMTLAASFLVAYYTLSFLLPRKFVSVGNYAWVIVLILPLWLVSLWSSGFYSSAVYGSNRRLFGRLVRAQSVAGLALLAMMYLTRSEGVSRLLMHGF